MDRGEQVMNFSTDSLQALLCTARKYMMTARGEDTGKMFTGYKIGRTGDRKVVELSANAGDIVEYIDGRIGVKWGYIWSVENWRFSIEYNHFMIMLLQCIHI